MTPEEAVNLVDLISETWGENFSTTRAAAWVAGLLDLPMDSAMSALRALSMSRSTTPAIATIRREVMEAAGVLPPDPQTAILQADAWLVYRDQLGYANGSGWTPQAPQVHPAVVSACGLVNGNFEGWRRDFLAAYDAAARSAEHGILSADYGHAVAALGDGR